MACDECMRLSLQLGSSSDQQDTSVAEHQLPRADGGCVLFEIPAFRCEFAPVCSCSRQKRARQSSRRALDWSLNLARAAGFLASQVESVHLAKYRKYPSLAFRDEFVEQLVAEVVNEGLRVGVAELNNTDRNRIRKSSN